MPGAGGAWTAGAPLAPSLAGGQSRRRSAARSARLPASAGTPGGPASRWRAAAVPLR